MHVDHKVMIKTHVTQLKCTHYPDFHFNKICIVEKKLFDLNIIIHSPYTSNNRYESVPQKWTDKTYSTHDLKEIWEECISTLFYVSVFPINIDLRTVFVVKKGKKTHKKRGPVNRLIRFFVQTNSSFLDEMKYYEIR